jgi:ribonuclease-3
MSGFRTSPEQDLESALGLRFRDPELLWQALVHRSFLNEQGGTASDSYERMEFLGDAVLGLVIATELYQRCPGLTEGELTKSRVALVRRETLAGVARRLGLGDFLVLGKGEEATGGRARDSTLAAVFEAVVGSVYLDRDYQEARQFVLRVMAKELGESFQQKRPPEDPKSRLQEYLQGLGRPSPHYRVVATEGPEHSPLFTVEVLAEEEAMGVGQGRKKVDAERAAAQDALERLVGW